MLWGLTKNLKTQATKRFNNFLNKAMEQQNKNRVKLGAFVLIATILLLVGLYFIGSNKNIFRSTIKVSADFNNVDGLMSGNNVLFNGINAGTVSKVYATADTNIRVEFTIDEDLASFVGQNAIASIGTDGMLGNTLVNIVPGTSGGKPLQDGDILKAENPFKMDKALKKLMATGDNLEVISDNLKSVSIKFNNSNSLWKLLADSSLANNVRSAVVNFKITGTNTAIVTGDLSKIVRDIKSGKGTMGTLLTDSIFSRKLKQTIFNFESISDSVALISGDFKNISDKIKRGDGALGMLITDTTFARNLNQSVINIKKGAGSFNDNMEGLQHSWLLKKYFKKEKEPEVK
jgi:phospholipid/cholesterol/gamma-HCH transport system substrate-binding protein